MRALDANGACERCDDPQRDAGKDDVVDPCEALAKELSSELFPEQCENPLGYYFSWILMGLFANLRGDVREKVERKFAVVIGGSDLVCVE